MNAILKNKLEEFFESHTDSTEVFVALGVLFTTLEKANRYLGGVKDHTAQCVTREEVESWNATQIDNSGTGGTTGQQSNDNTNSTEGTEAGSAGSPSESTNETGQNTKAGNVIESGDPGDEQSHVDNRLNGSTKEENERAHRNTIAELEKQLEELKASGAHHSKVKSIQKKIAAERQALEKLSS